MRSTKWLILALTVALTLAAGPVQAQTVSDSDFLEIVPASFDIPDNNIDTSFHVAVMLDSKTTFGAISLPVMYNGHPTIGIDTTVVTAGNKGVSYGPAGQLAVGWTLQTSLIDDNVGGILVGFISFAAVGPQSDTLCYIYYDVDASGVNGTVPLDSGTVNNQNLRITDVGAGEHIPTWSPGVVNIGSPQPAIGLDPTELTFSATIGAGNPASQTFDISNTGAGTLNWTATPSDSWLAATPSGAPGPATVTVTVNTAGLPAGTQTGYVVVADPAATNTPESLTVTLNLTMPSLSASPGQLSFIGQAGGTNPNSQTVTLTASQGASIGWTGSVSSTWLMINPDNGTTPNSITVSTDITGLSDGIYRDTIVITAPSASNTPVRIPIQMLLTAPPIIALAPDSVFFSAIAGGTEPAPDTVQITNAGTGTLDFATSTDQPWLFATPASGNAPASIEVSTSISGLVASIYTGHVIVTSASGANSPESIFVELDVQADPPVISVTPTSASFTATEGDAMGNPVATSVAIANTGGGNLNWSIIGLDSAWVNVSQTSGGAPDTFEVSVDPTGLTAGTYQEIFEIVDPSAVGSPVTFTVNLDVQAGPPTISVSPVTFAFAAVENGTDPPPQAMTITNVGGSQPLNWTTTNSESWLTLSDVSGTAPSSTDLQVDVTGLGAGVYSDTIIVSATGATNTPQQIPVELTIVEPPPFISVAPDSLVFGATVGNPNPPAQTLAITNLGGGILDWTAATDQPWLGLDDSSGTAPSGILVDVDIAGLTPNTYSGNVTIASPGATNTPVVVPVTLVVSDLPPVLTVSPTSLSYSATEGDVNPPSQGFFVSNTGGGIMTWTVSTGASWIVQLDPTGGVNDDNVSVFVDISGLTAGTYIDSVLVDAGSTSGSPQYVIVTLELDPPPPPSIVLDPTSFTFTALFGGGNPASKNLNITNSGGRTLDWNATNSEGWLSLSDNSGTAPSVTSLNIDVTGLAVGTYYDTVVVSSDSADNSPQIATVQLDVVDNPPQLVLAPSTFDFEIVVGDPDPPTQTMAVTNAGAGTLSWTATKKAAWLTVNPASGNAPTSVDLSVTGAGLIPGTYRDTIVVTSLDAFNSPQEAIITFVVKSVAKPSIDLQPDSLYYIVSVGQMSDPQCTYVWIDGNGGRLIWRARTDASWISLSRDSCNISYPLCVVVDAAGVEPGIYCDSVEISGDADNSPQFLHICMDVRGGGEQPVLVVQDSVYNFTATEGDSTLTAPEAFTVTNGGTGTLAWTASTLAHWIVIDPTGGIAPSSGTYRVDPTGVPAGTYQATVEFDAPGALNSPQFVTIHLTVEEQTQDPAVLAVTPTSISRTAPEGSGVLNEQLAIANTGGGVLNWSIDQAGLSSWLTVAPASGSAPGQSLVTLNPVGLTPGTYQDTIVVGSIEAINSPVEVPVVLTVQSETVDSDSVYVMSKGSSPGGTAVVPVYFDNSQPLFGLSVPLTWTGERLWADSVSFAGSRVAGVDVLAASVDTTKREIRIGVVPLQSDPIPVGSGLLANVYFTIDAAATNQTAVVDSMTTTAPPISLTFVDTNTTEYVPGFASGEITVAGAQEPTLAVDPDSLHFEATAGGSNPAAQYAVVMNTGGSFLTFETSENVPWLSVNPTTGQQGDSVFLAVDISGLSQNLYTGVVRFTSTEAGDTVHVKVTLNVEAGTDPPLIVLAPDQLSFSMTVGDALPAPDTISVSNGGGGTLAWTAAFSESWLAVTPLSGGDGTQVQVSITDAGLAAGEYFDTIEFTDAAAANSPRTALVELRVTAPAGPDTVFISSATAAPGDTVTMSVRVRNSFAVTGMALPFLHNGNGVTFLPGATPTPRAGAGVFPVQTELLDTVNYAWALYGFISFALGMPAGDGDVLEFKVAIAPDAPDQVVTFDTTFLPPANVLVLNDAGANEIFPEFVAGTLTIQSGQPSSIWISETIGEPGDEVMVEVHADNAQAIERLLLPLQLTSLDATLVRAEFTGTRSQSGTPTFTMQDDQHATLDVSWGGSGLDAGIGVVARLFIALDAFASPQTLYVDTAGDYGFTIAGGSNQVVVPGFNRGIVQVDIASDTEDPTLPRQFALQQNMPNPFNPTTRISYTLIQGAPTRLTVYNLLGREIVTLVNDFQSAGDHTITWNGRDGRGQVVSSGVYLYRLESGGDVTFRKMTLMK